MGAYTGVPSSSEGRSKPEWALEILALEALKSNEQFEIRLTNISDHALRLPIGLDGRLVVDRCPESRFQDAELSFIPANRSAIVSYHLYGCSALTETLISVKPEDWVTLKGLYPIQSHATGSERMSVNFSLAASHYYKTKDGWMEDRVGTLDIVNNEH